MKTGGGDFRQKNLNENEELVQCKLMYKMILNNLPAHIVIACCIVLSLSVGLSPIRSELVS